MLVLFAEKGLIGRLCGATVFLNLAIFVGFQCREWNQKGMMQGSSSIILY